MKQQMPWGCQGLNKGVYRSCKSCFFTMRSCFFNLWNQLSVLFYLIIIVYNWKVVSSASLYLRIHYKVLKWNWLKEHQVEYLHIVCNSFQNIM